MLRFHALQLGDQLRDFVIGRVGTAARLAFKHLGAKIPKDRIRVALRVRPVELVDRFFGLGSKFLGFVEKSHARS